MNKNIGLRALQANRLRKQGKKEAEILMPQAIAAYRSGRLADVQTICMRLLEFLPEHFDALHLLGLSTLDSGRPADAEPILRRALDVNPRSPDAHSNLGVAQFELNQFEAACGSYRRAIALRQNSPTALNNLGNALIKLRQTDAALDSFDRAIALDPNYVDAMYNRGMALLLLNRSEDALASIDRALALRPRYLEALAGKGLVQYTLRQFDGALESLNAALAIKPDFAEALVNLGVVQLELAQTDTARASLEAALSLRPDMVSAWLAQAKLCMSTNRVAEAIAACEAALRIDPASEKALVYLGSCQTRQGNSGAAVEMYDRALAINPGYEEAISRKVFALDLVGGADFEIQQAARHFWWEQIGARIAQYPPRQADDPERRLSVGYVSSDFRNHSAARAFMPVLRHHDPEQFQISCYSSSTLPEDEITAECRRLSHRFVEAAQLSDQQLAERIRADGIDILVDLSGHTAGNRLKVFARKPAPLQVTAWGHATGTGLPTIDYLFSDPIACPTEARPLFAEAIHDLPCLITCEPPPAPVPVAPPPVLARNYITFGIYNRIDKLFDEVLAVWAGVLAALPTSRIVFKNGSLDDAFIRDALTKRLVALGVDAGRIDCVGNTSRNDHLLAFRDVDISLDPFPHNGGASTWESLQMGVPVIALLGSGTCARVAASILHAIGLDDWIADSTDDYIALAVKFAAMPEHLRSLRAALPGIIANSPAGDGEQYARHVEQAYRTFWRKLQADG